MKKSINWLLSLLVLVSFSCQQKIDMTVSSPDGLLVVEVQLSEQGIPSYTVAREEQAVLESSQLGLIRSDVDFSQDLTLEEVSSTELVKDDYILKVGKKREISYDANKKVFKFSTAEGKQIDVIFQVSNDGVVFRYFMPSNGTEMKFVEEEKTTFNFSEDSKAWLQPCANAKTGWGITNPSYEENYLMEIAVDTESPNRAGWVYPALFKSNDNWVLISEAGLGKDYCGTRLEGKSPNGEYKIGFPQKEEKIFEGELFPQSAGDWYSPWRIIAVGSLKTITESTLGTDVANPAIDGDFSWVKPGRASWSWIILKDDETTFPVQKRFIDYAADMGWEYCLVDALWDTQIGYEKIQELIDYAAAKDVGLILWYNSAGDWNTTHQTPKDMMLTKESRLNEFAKIKEMGIKGVKVDFFGGDGQSVIQYYQEILEDAAQVGIMVNFHGCTLPRGWQRTYPNLVTMESIKGMEFITFDQANADVSVPHCAMLPFTRNVFDPMDFTPVCFSEIPNISRRSSNGFELALSTLFVSGVQHYAETAQGMGQVPIFVKEAMKAVPVAWDESVFVDGFPGKHVVMARRSGDKWFIAGINGEEIPKDLVLDLSFIKGAKTSLITDGETDREWVQKDVTIGEDGKLSIGLIPNGGFLIQVL
ncbi:MAG: glycoside hydrolase family 97 protein [Reichenbachiella sp.]